MKKLLLLTLLALPVQAQDRDLLAVWIEDPDLNSDCVRITDFNAQTWTIYDTEHPIGSGCGLDQLLVWHPGQQRTFDFHSSVILGQQSSILLRTFDANDVFEAYVFLDNPFDELGRIPEIRWARRFGDFILYGAITHLLPGGDCRLGRIGGFNVTDPVGTHQQLDLGLNELPMDAFKAHGFFWIVCNKGTVVRYNAATGLSKTELPLNGVVKNCTDTQEIKALCYDGGGDRMVLITTQPLFSSPDQVVEFAFDGETDPNLWTKTDLTNVVLAPFDFVRDIEAGAGGEFYVACRESLRRINGQTLTTTVMWNRNAKGAPKTIDYSQQASFTWMIRDPEGRLSLYRNGFTFPFGSFALLTKWDAALNQVEEFALSEEEIFHFFWLTGRW